MPGRKCDRLSPMIGPDISTFPLAFMWMDMFVEGYAPIVTGGFEPPSRAPKALRIDLYPTGLTMFSCSPHLDLLLPGLYELGRACCNGKVCPHNIYMAFPGEFQEMKLLTREHVSQRRLVEILRVIESAGSPVGARAISSSLCSRGYDLGERTVRYNLKILDGLGFTRKEGYSGRVLTPLGARELGCALV